MPFIDYGLDVIYYVCMPRNKGQPRRFANGSELEQAMKDYLAQGDKFPNLAGFCVSADLNYDTYYMNKEYYPESFKNIELMLESAVLNVKPELTTRGIFYMKNKFKKDYQDRVEQAIFTPEPLKINYDKLSEEELRTIKDILDK